MTPLDGNKLAASYGQSLHTTYSLLTQGYFRSLYGTCTHSSWCYLFSLLLPLARLYTVVQDTVFNQLNTITMALTSQPIESTN